MEKLLKNRTAAILKVSDFRFQNGNIKPIYG